MLTTDLDNSSQTCFAYRLPFRFHVLRVPYFSDLDLCTLWLFGCHSRHSSSISHFLMVSSCLVIICTFRADDFLKSFGNYLQKFEFSKPSVNFHETVFLLLKKEQFNETLEF